MYSNKLILITVDPGYTVPAYSDLLHIVNQINSPARIPIRLIVKLTVYSEPLFNELSDIKN